VKRASVVVAAAAGIALLAYAVHTTGLSQFRSALVRLGWGFGAILVLSGAREVVRALAWMRAVEGPTHLSFNDAIRARLAGEALNTLLPMGMLVGEPAKAANVSHRLPFASAFGALAIELAFYGASLLLLFAAGVVAFIPSSGALFAAAAPLVTVAHFRRGDRGADPMPSLITRVRRLVEPVLTFASRHPAQARSIVALEIVCHLSSIVEVYVTLMFIDPGRATWTAAVIFEAVSRAVTMVFKILPMRIGVDEAGAAMVAARLHLGPPTGVVLALVRKIRLLCWSAVGLVILVLQSHRVSWVSSQATGWLRLPAARR
jgi:hypothetical protein